MFQIYWQETRIVQLNGPNSAKQELAYSVPVWLSLINWPLGDFNKIALRWTSLDLSDDKSTLAQVMAWRRQATSHCLNQC